MKKNKVITSSEFSSDYTMDFSDNGNNSGGGNNPKGGRDNGSKTPQQGGRSSVRLIISALLFMSIIGLILYFFVFRTSNNVTEYSDNAIVYNVDYLTGEGNTATRGQDGKADPIEGMYPLGSNESLGDYVIKGSEGELAKVLLYPSAQSNSVTENRPYLGVYLTVTFSNQSSKLVILNGGYKVANKKGQFVDTAFRCNVTYESYLKYIVPITDYVTVNVVDSTTSTSKIVKYYSYQNKTLATLSVQQSSNIMSWLFPLLSLVVMVGFLFFLYNRMMKSGGGSNPMSGFVNNVARKQSGSKIRFSDVAGCDEAKAELVEMVDYFHATDKYTRLGAKLPHGVLLVGPPGTGKTLLAKAVAGEANVPFYSISGSDFVEMYVGVGASRVRSLFKTAKQNAPCLIFIDEIDAVGRQRGAGLGGGNDEREQTLNELLVEMDGFEDNNGVIVMAATNRSDVLDPALTRPGRFDRQITVDLPDKDGRAAILKVHAKNKKIATDVSFDSIASRTVGFSGADLANIMNDAAILAVRSNRSAITTSDIDEAIDRAIAGPAKKSHLEAEEKKQVAYHEAGHAVIGLFLPYSDKVQKITIIPRGRTGGHVRMTPEHDRFLMTKNQLLARITGYLGGRTSEEIFFGDVSTGASNDIEVATTIARSMVTEYGMSDLGPIQYEKPGGSVFLGRDYSSTQSNYSTQIAYEIDKAIRSIVDDCHLKARALLEEHRDDVILIAETLIARETITADQIEYLLKNRKLPEVDEHKLTDTTEIKNPNNVILYPGYQEFYHELDNILAGNPSRIVLAVSIGTGEPISVDKFKEAAVKSAKDPSHIGVMLLDYSQSMKISMTVESFGEHLEAYCNVPFLLVKTDEASIQNLKATFSSKKEETKTRVGVVKEILPSDKQNDDKKEEGNDTDDNDDSQSKE